MLITIKVVSSNSVHVIKLFSLRFPLPIKLTVTITEILLSSELNTMNQTIRRLQKWSQISIKVWIVKTVDLIMKNILYICRHPKYEDVGLVRTFLSLWVHAQCLFLKYVMRCYKMAIFISYPITTRDTHIRGLIWGVIWKLTYHNLFIIYFKFHLKRHENNVYFGDIFPCSIQINSRNIIQIYPVSEGYLRKIPVERRVKFPEPSKRREEFVCPLNRYFPQITRTNRIYLYNISAIYLSTDYMKADSKIINSKNTAN